MLDRQRASLLLITFLGLANVGFTIRESVAYRLQSEERQLENKIPEHLPIRARLAPEKEKAFHDMSNKEWAGDLEIEVKNIGDRPIYYLRFDLKVPDRRIKGGELGFDLIWGENSVFGDFKGNARAGETPLKPGESCVLKIWPSEAKAWPKIKEIENWPQPDRVILVFRELNFGDGTGFWDDTGVPWPTPRKRSI